MIKSGVDGDLPEAGCYEVMALVYHNLSYPHYDLQRWSGSMTPPGMDEG